MNGLGGSWSELQSDLSELKDKIAQNKNSAIQEVERLASEIAKAYIDQFHDIKDDEMVDLCTRYQASIFWLFKDCPDQPQHQKEQDYFDAQRYISFLISDSVLTTCAKDGTCPLLKLSEMHLKLMQSLSLIEHVRDKAYLGWIERTRKRSLSSQGELLEDFRRACSYIHESVVLCNACPSISDFNYWKSICNQVRSNHRATMDEKMTLCLGSNDIEGLFSYCSYIFRLLTLTDILINGDNLSWQDLRSLLYFIHNRPDLSSIYELIILRVMVSSKISEYIQKTLYYDRLNIPEEKKDEIIFEFIDAQAWLFWFLKLCPNQDYHSQIDDYHNAKRYVAFLIAENIVDETEDSSFMKKCLSLSNTRIRLLQGLSIEEYCQHKSYSEWQYSRFIKKEESFPREAVEKYTCSKKYLCNKEINESIKKDSHVKDGIRNLYKKAEFQPLNEIKQAKRNTLCRLSKLTEDNSRCVNDGVESYEEINTALDMGMTPSLSLPSDFHIYTPVFNMFEYILSLISPASINQKSKSTHINPESVRGEGRE